MLWLGLVLLGALIGASIVVAYLYWDDLLAWFRENIGLLRSNANNVAVAVREALDSGNYNVVTGIINQETGEVLNAQSFIADGVDPRIKEGVNVLS